MSLTMTMTPKDDGPPVKRRKTTLACEECRERKRKCDGIRPICGACAKKLRGMDCVFEDGRSRRGWDKSYIDSLLRRIRHLESAQDALGVSHPPSTTINVTSTGQGPLPNFQNDTRLSRPPGQNGDERMQDDHSKISKCDQAHNIHDTCMSYQAPAIGSMGKVSQFPTTQHCEGSQQPFFSIAKSHDSTEHPTRPAPSTGEIEEDRDDRSEDERGDGQHVVDAMGSTSGNLNDASPSLRQESAAYFGPSSAVTFMNQVQNAIAKIGGMSPTSNVPEEERGDVETDFSLDLMRATANNTLESRRSDWSDLNLWEFSIPPRKQADALVATYWTSVDSLYPFLHRSTFTTKYLKIWQSTEQGPVRPEQQRSYDRKHADLSPRDKLFYCTLNAVFALACHFHGPIPFRDRASTSDLFFNRAKKLLSFDIMEQGSIQLVQTLLLLGQYLQSTEMVGSCWNIVGLAIRVAQGLGLHLPSRNDETSQLQTELRRRLWGGCILLDRVLSMTYGRPFMVDPVTARNMILPSIFEDECLPTSPGNLDSQSEHPPSQMAFYVHALKLQGILGQILAALYHGTHDQASDGCKSDERSGPTADRVATPSLTEKVKAGNFQSLLALDSSLNKWQNSLPYYLRVDQGQTDRTLSNLNDQRTIFGSAVEPNKSPIFVRQANVLQARYLHIRILLLRPLLLVLFQYEQQQTDSGPDSDSMNTILHRAMLTKISNLCISTAQDLVDLIVTGWITSGTEALPAWWYNVFYIYTSATVILTARLCPLMEGWKGERNLMESWDKCLKFLQEFQIFSRSAWKCYKVLQMIDMQFTYTQRQQHDNEVHPRVNTKHPQTNHTPTSHEIETRAPGIIDNTYIGGPDMPPVSVDLQLSGADFFVPDASSSSKNRDNNMWMRDMLDMDWLTSMPLTSMDDTVNIDGGFEW